MAPRGPRKPRALPPMSAEDAERERILRAEGNKLYGEGKVEAAEAKFSEARKIREGARKDSEKWSTALTSFRTRCFRPALIDDENDIAIVSATIGAHELSLNKKVVRVIRGVRFGVAFVSEDDERIADKLREKHRDYVPPLALLAEKLPRKKEQALVAAIEELRGAIGKHGASHNPFIEDVSVTYFDKLNNPDDDLLTDSLGLHVDNTPGIGQTPTLPLNLQALFNGNLPQEQLINLFNSVRATLSQTTARIVGSVRGGESRRR